MGSTKIRYGVVGLGDIAQGAMLPGVKHTDNSEVTALVTSDPEKAEKVARTYGVKTTCDYDGFGSLIRSGKIDAIYLATPNWRHAEFAIPALEAGIHVLAEKPLEVSSEKCRAILDAQKRSSAKLMVAYRLHFEPATMSLVRRIRRGELGEVHMMTAVFAQMVDPKNHRAKNGELAGPLFDMGPYPVNASRYVFRAEPTAVISAFGTRHPKSGFDQDFADTVAATLEFPQGRIAQFTISYYGNSIGTYSVVGTKGTVKVDPGFTYGSSIEQDVAFGDSSHHEKFKATDQFGGELKYFSNCLLNGLEIEPDGEEGLADVRVLEGILEAMKTGARVELPPFERTRRIDPDEQEERLGLTRKPEKVNAESPTR